MISHCKDGDKCTMGGCICSCMDCMDADREAPDVPETKEPEQA